MSAARSRRTLVLPAVTIDSLRRHRVRQLEARLVAGQAWRDTDLVFTSTIGTPREPRRLTRDFHALLARGGLPRVRLHDLRHYLPCHALACAGREPAGCVETLAHSQVSLTLNTYSHVLPTLREDAAAKMNAILES